MSPKPLLSVKRAPIDTRPRGEAIPMGPRLFLPLVVPKSYVEAFRAVGVPAVAR